MSKPADKRPKGADKSPSRTSPAPPPERPAAKRRRLADAAVIDRLHELVARRRGADPRQSHSARLLARGTTKVAQKLGEETFECLIEAVAGNRDNLIGESADVLYHLIVLWVDRGVSPAEVWAELERREGRGGIEEKAARTADGVRSDAPARP